MRPTAFASLLLALLVGALAPAAGVAEESLGRAYAQADLPGLLHGLGHESRELDSGGLGFRVARSAFATDMQLLMSSDGGRLLVYAPLAEWKDPKLAPDAVLTGLLEKTGEIGPSRFYVREGRGTFWVGIVRSVDNRDVEPSHLRTVIDEVFDQAQATQSLWDPDRWTAVAPGAPSAPSAPGGADAPK